MIIYHTHSLSSNDRHVYRDKFVSFSINNLQNKNQIDCFTTPCMGRMLDSGILGGERVSIEEYVAFIENYRQFISIYINYDIIGDPEATFQNQKFMESRGLYPIPVYHVTEKQYYLDCYCDNYDYIAIGGMRDFTIKENKKFLKEIFKHKNRFHGLGCTNENATEFPFYSVDSSTAVQNRRFMDSKKAFDIISQLYPDQVLSLSINHTERKMYKANYNRKESLSIDNGERQLSFLENIK